MSATQDDGIRDLVAFFADVDDVEVCFFISLELARISLALIVADSVTLFEEDYPLPPVRLGNRHHCTAVTLALYAKVTGTGRLPLAY